MRIDLGVMRAEGALERRVYEFKSMAFCKTRDGTREHRNGCSWADRRAALAIKERTDQARKLDAGLFRGTALAPMETALGSLGLFFLDLENRKSAKTPRKPPLPEQQGKRYARRLVI